MVEQVRALAREIADSKAILFLGRHVGYPVALEGALKLKELAYMHAEGFPAGELKHGPIALIEAGPAGGGGDAVADRPAAAAPEDAVQHRRDLRPRRPHHRDRRAGRRAGRQARRAPDRGAGRADAAVAAA